MEQIFEVKITFQVTEKVSVDAASADEAIRRAIVALGERYEEARFIDATQVGTMREAHLYA